ncbi:hypothetical protein MUK42_03279 [Musa troglodytarum]|uniref:Uncharacterized protein n=1 Tax=Musa troglodytarum TaxID=320322 RepID=A0A9E7KD78_9LILI|nr:hypothetical protein MUK42_03279 [Musa troglodytarum]
MPDLPILCKLHSSRIYTRSFSVVKLNPFGVPSGIDRIRDNRGRVGWHKSKSNNRILGSRLSWLSHRGSNDGWESECVIVEELGADE